jgi:hypothetical protein
MQATFLTLANPLREIFGSDRALAPTVDVTAIRGVSVSAIESKVLEDFFHRMENDDSIPSEVVASLRLSLAAEKLPKADLLVELYFRCSGELMQ